MGLRFIISLAFLFITHPVNAGSTVDSDQVAIEASIEKLDRINFLPNMLPVILDNRDFIGLTDAQVSELESWRNQNREPMLAAMKQVASKRVEIKQAALSPNISSARLQQMQNDIFRLQREILGYKLSCRDQVVRTFNNENWSSFFMVLADEPIGVVLPTDLAEK